MKTILLMIYIWNGKVKIDQRPVADVKACIEQAQLIKAEFDNDPRFEEMLGGWCMPADKAPLQAAKE